MTTSEQADALIARGRRGALNTEEQRLLAELAASTRTQQRAAEGALRRARLRLEWARGVLVDFDRWLIPVDAVREALRAIDGIVPQGAPSPEDQLFTDPNYPKPPVPRAVEDVAGDGRL